MSRDHHVKGNVPGDKEISLQDIIKERKGEKKVKAEEKRQLDLQRISNMRSVTGIDPLGQFPKEIWAEIFQNLDPEDRGNAWPVHPTFRDLMESNRLRDILLPMVLKVDTFERYFSEISSELKYERLREVSKSIMKSFDRRMEEKVLKRIQETDDYGFTGVVSLSLPSREDRRMLNRLLVSFQNDQANPGKHFFPRNLSILFIDDSMEFDEDGQDIQEVFEDFKRRLTSLLEIIGAQILHFKFDFDEVTVRGAKISPLQMYILLQQFVTSMPNLQWLEVSILKQVIYLGNRTRSALQNHPFPRLASLIRFSCNRTYEAGLGDEVFIIFQAIIEANTQVKILDLDEVVDVNFEGDEEQLSNDVIQSLPLTSFRHSGVQLIGAETLENIQEIVSFNWCLKTISLSFDYQRQGRTSTLPPILRFLERFPSLEIVTLKELKGFRFGENDKFEYLKLPNLKDFKFVLTEPEISFQGNIHFFFSLQFLLYCKNLKMLEWKMRLVEGVDFELRKHLKNHENQNSIDFRAGMSVLYESNIWKVFPSLDTIKVDIAKIPRAAYGRHGSHPSCVHHYRRRSFLDGMISIKQFLEGHKCSCNNTLQNCVILQE